MASTVSLTPAGWFDSLPPINPPDFQEKHPGWCLRHYAPAVRLHGNHIGATIQLARTVVGLIKAALPEGSTVTTGQITEYLGQHSEPACCLAGDELMYEIWSHWLPRT
jgi:hypothetical protein